MNCDIDYLTAVLHCLFERIGIFSYLFSLFASLVNEAQTNNANTSPVQLQPIEQLYNEQDLIMCR